MGPDYKNQLRLRKEGTTIDHIAVRMTIKIPYQWKKQPSRAMPRWDQHQLQKFEEEWEKNRLNQQVKKPVEVDQNLIEQAEQLREAIKQALKENCKEGYGLQVWPDGSKYEGFWQKDMANGYGRFILADGDVFEGNWVDDKAHGLGNYFYAEGATYKG
jgi:hypothetical protein